MDQPHAMVGDLDRVAVALVRRRCSAHPADPSKGADTHQRDSAPVALAVDSPWRMRVKMMV